MWGWVIGGTIAAGSAAWYAWSEYSARKAAEKARQDEAERAERARIAAEQEARDLRASALKVRSNLAPDILSDFLIIDANIWMNEKYDPFFLLLTDVVSEAKRPVVLFGGQFDEMCNIKRETPYGEVKNKRARLALSRIEKLQTQALLRIEAVNINSKRGAYADPLVLILLMTLSEEPRTVAFFSDDRELRIRARELVADGKATVKIVDARGLADDLDLFARARANDLV